MYKWNNIDKLVTQILPQIQKVKMIILKSEKIVVSI